MIKAMGYSTSHSFTHLKPLEFEREEAVAHGVEIDVLLCGVRHSEIEQPPPGGPGR